MAQRDVQTRRIEAADLLVAYVDSARDKSAAPANVSREAPPLLLLHGAVQTARIWDRQIKDFSPERRVLAPDLRGHGTTRGCVDDLTIERLARDQIVFLDTLGIERAVVCGVSLGGMVALEMAERWPERIAALIVADTPLALSLKPAVRRYVDRIGPQRVLKPAFAVFGQACAGRIGLFAARLLFGREWVGEVAGRHFLAGFAAMPADAIVEVYAAIVKTDPAALRKIAVPCLVIVGRRDTSLILDHAHMMDRRIEGAEIVQLDAGHVANLDAPEAFNVAVRLFLGQQE